MQTADMHPDPQDEHWRLYSASHIVLPTTGQLLVGPGAIDDLPLPGPLHVVTAHNPAGLRRADAHNTAANVALQKQLIALGVAFLPADGMSPDGSWVEGGFAVSGLPRAGARALAAAFEQDAFFEITVHHVIIITTAETVIVSSRSRRFD